MGSSIKIWVIGLVVIWGLGLSAGSVKGQTAAEFLRQKKTQEKYLLKQLAYLQLYGSEIRKGYELAKKGLGVIEGFTSTEMNLHEGFFGAMATVSPVIRNDFRVLDIAKMQLAIRSNLGALLASTAGDQGLNLYIAEVRKKVINECDSDLDELLDIVLSGELEMSDQGRLQRLKLVHQAMKEKAAFTMHFCAEVQGLLVNRKGYDVDLKQLRRFYEKH